MPAPENGGGGDDLLERGRRVRAEVLGQAHVDQSTSGTDAFLAPLMDFGTRYCWGDVWAREGLDRRTRSLVNLGMLVALNRADELKLHVQGALNNGCTEREIQETLLQTAVYAGLPAAVEGFKVAKGVLDARSPGGG